MIPPPLLPILLIITSGGITTTAALSPGSARTSQDQQINICQDVQTRDGCITSAALGSVYFTCGEDGVQTLFTCDGGCQQHNAANLPTCDNGKLFGGTID